MSQTSLIKNTQDLTFQDHISLQSQETFKLLPSKISHLIARLEEITRESNQMGNKDPNKPKDSIQTPVSQEYIIFCQHFKHLSRQQQSDFLHQIKNQIVTNLLNEAIYPNQEKEFHCSFRVDSSCVPYWNKAVLKMTRNNKILVLTQKDRKLEIHIREYLLRRSKKHSLCFVLENVGFAARSMQYNFHIKFDDKDADAFAEAENTIKRAIIKTMGVEIREQIKEIHKKKEEKKVKKIMMFLTKKQMEKFAEMERQHHQRKSKELDISNQFEMIEETALFKIYMNKMDDSMFKVSFNQQNCPLVLNNFIQCYKSQHKMVYQLKVLEQVSQQSISHFAVYKKTVWKEKIYGQLFIAKQNNFTLQALKSAPLTIFSLSNIDHQTNSHFISHLQIGLKKEENNLEILFFVKFAHQLGSDASREYLHQMINVFKDEKDLRFSHSQANILYNDMCSEVNQNKREIVQEEIKPISQQKATKLSDKGDIDQMFSGNFTINNKDLEGKKTAFSNTFTRTTYQLTPSKHKRGKIMKEHFLWKHWKRAEKGGLVCKDEELVEKQKKMFKLVIKKFGETLLMGKNIINFSLPVIVFKKESHLQSLAKSYLYSPIFTEKAASIQDPLQRMKFSIILMMTENALSIHMQKPFNPILGETYQGWIDGCPIYLEQISHHPPISAYYFLGRGYKKYGCIQPKISVGLNNASGYSIFPHYVDFDDGMKIQYICAKILIGGLLIGERTFNFQDKIYAYDRKHRYFASLKFGPVKKGFFTSSNEPDDYFHGYIYEVTPEFQKYFDKEKGIKPHPQEEHIVQKLTFFDGIWNSFVNVNGEEVLNLKTDLPYQFQEEKTPLPSNSSYRQDLMNLLSGDLESAQAAKEQMEEIQRNDRRLRQQYSE